MYSSAQDDSVDSHRAFLWEDSEHEHDMGAQARCASSVENKGLQYLQLFSLKD